MTGVLILEVDTELGNTSSLLMLFDVHVWQVHAFIDWINLC